jgi:Uma2 family endonuclease
MYQTDPPRPPKEILPTMYDLPSEDLEEPGVPDQFHLWQPRLLDETFRPPTYPPDEVFTASDLNLYYDLRRPNWYKRPDWFAAVGVSRLYEQKDLRLSYVVWQEGVNPFVAIELLSPGTEKEDLGQTLREVNQPLTKWQVYEQILRIPYYIVFDHYTDRLQMFQLVADRYSKIEPKTERLWIPSLDLGLGLRQGSYQGVERQWLRWFDAQGDRVPTPSELEAQRSQKLTQRLREMGVDPDLV